jgi:hypothetical protein
MLHHWARAVVVLALSSSVGLAQSATAVPPAPKDKAMDLPLEMLQAVPKEVAAKGQITQRVLEGGRFSVNVRKAGDLVFIPPGVPHGINQATSITYLNIRFEIQ